MNSYEDPPLSELSDLYAEIDSLHDKISELQQDLQTTADALGHAHADLSVSEKNLTALRDANAWLQKALEVAQRDARAREHEGI